VLRRVGTQRAWQYGFCTALDIQKYDPRENHKRQVRCVLGKTRPSVGSWTNYMHLLGIAHAFDPMSLDVAIVRSTNVLALVVLKTVRFQAVSLE